MADRPARRKPKLHRGRVESVQRLTPHMVRVVFGGEGLADFTAGSCTDHYIKLLFPVDGVAYPDPLDMEVVRRDFPRDQWPRIRTYTVRAWDPAALELTVEFVVHGHEGLAGPWAARARPGDEIPFQGPGGGYAPSPEADWHLLVGDESALPAIAASLEGMPAGAPAKVFVEVAGPEEEQKLDSPGEADIVWLHRGDRQIGDALVEAVQGLEFPSGTVQAFVHGEANAVKTLRRHLRIDRGLVREQLSISGYWRRGADEDGWQASKADWNRQVELEQEPSPA